MILTGKPEILGVKPVSVSGSPPQVPHRPALNRTRASVEMLANYRQMLIKR
jgi:hypothetical protein